MLSRLRRIFRGFMAIKSVILGALILALWIRSYRSADTIVRGDATQSIGLTSAAGRPGPTKSTIGTMLRSPTGMGLDIRVLLGLVRPDRGADPDPAGWLSGRAG